MLTKLLKYDFKNMWKALMPMYIIVLCFSVMSRVVSILSDKFQIISYVEAFINVIYILSLIFLFIYTMIVSIQKFYKEVFKDQGYLTNTLPVKKSSILTSKLIVSSIFIILAVVVVVFALFISFYESGTLDVIKTFISAINTNIDLNIYAAIAIFSGLILVSYIQGILMIYLSIAIGHISSKDKIAYSIISYIIIYTITQAFGVITMLVLYLVDPSIMQFTNEVMLPHKIFYEIITVSGVVTAILLVLYYISTVHVLNKKLNLE